MLLSVLLLSELFRFKMLRYVNQQKMCKEVQEPQSVPFDYDESWLISMAKLD